MKRRGFKVELVESGLAGSIYTILFYGESQADQTEFDKFLSNKAVISQKASLQRLLAKLTSMSNDYGFPGEFFKEEEGARRDYVVALREQKLRLYCLRIDKVLLVVGNGGVKTTQTYQEDPLLFASVEDLQMVHDLFMKRYLLGKIRVDRNTGILRGSLDFHIDN